MKSVNPAVGGRVGKHLGWGYFTPLPLVKALLFGFVLFFPSFCKENISQSRSLQCLHFYFHAVKSPNLVVYFFISIFFPPRLLGQMEQSGIQSLSLCFVSLISQDSALINFHTKAEGKSLPSEVLTAGSSPVRMENQTNVIFRIFCFSAQIQQISHTSASKKNKKQLSWLLCNTEPKCKL